MADQLMGKIADAVTSARSIEQLTRPLLFLLEKVTGLDSTYLTRIDQGAGVQDILFARNSRQMQIPEGLSVPWDDTSCKRALEEGRMFTNNVEECWGDSDAARALGIRTYVSMPVRLDDGSLFGTLCAASDQSRPVGSEGEQVLALFSGLISQYIQREQLLERLQKANATLEGYSFTDGLTGLPNRRSIMTELARLFSLANRTDQHVLVVFIDLDGFKAINDCHGHDIGDEFLIEIGRRLSNGLRLGDLLGRLGGDEFVIVGLVANSRSTDNQSVEALRDRLQTLIRGRYELSDCQFDYGGASFGVITVDPEAISPDEALRQADAAMYVEKRKRRMASAH